MSHVFPRFQFSAYIFGGYSAAVFILQSPSFSTSLINGRTGHVPPGGRPRFVPLCLKQRMTQASCVPCLNIYT
jgi:hypothetical protein